jgi:hypothetical protein
MVDRNQNRNLPSDKALRTAGQAGLLTVNILFAYCIVNTTRQSRRENPGKRTHPTLLLLLATCPLLLVRGLYGVMSGVVPGFNYYDPNNYGETGLTKPLVVSEYIMGTSMEWVSCTLLMLTYFTSPNDSGTADSEVYSEGKKDRSDRAVEA